MATPQRGRQSGRLASSRHAIAEVGPQGLRGLLDGKRPTRPLGQGRHKSRATWPLKGAQRFVRGRQLTHQATRKLFVRRHDGRPHRTAPRRTNGRPPLAGLLACGSIVRSRLPGPCFRFGPVASWERTRRIQLRGQPRTCLSTKIATNPFEVQVLRYPAGTHRVPFSPRACPGDHRCFDRCTAMAVVSTSSKVSTAVVPCP